MPGDALLTRLADACAAHGPGRLPGADRPAVGAGYAFATAALVALAGCSVPFGVDVSLVATPFVVPAAFVAGAACFPPIVARDRGGPAVAGAAVVLVTYLLATLALLAVLGVWNVWSAWGGPAAPLVGAGLVGGLGFALTLWIAVPVGAVAGSVHDRARGRHD
ncbi:hypothetical protein [Halobaculum litoreum]|uniref:Uncharacterized protein n=1 Tax=Halobaculum litoreum TaxID=3031998 RepID=A0ABD5XRL2_9EURY|nr:hypothetical protein [Halobaculum sp. DT92]